MLMTKTTQIASFRLAVALALAWIAGCRGESRLTVNPVRGQVVYNGRGVPNATVIFHPLGDAAKKLQRMRPYAYADQNGRFELKTYVTGDGAPPGEYEVGIIATAGSDRDSGSDSQSDSPTLPRALMQKCANQKTSGVKVTVQSGENVLAPFV